MLPVVGQIDRGHAAAAEHAAQLVAVGERGPEVQRELGGGGHEAGIYSRPGSAGGDAHLPPDNAPSREMHVDSGVPETTI